ncbi:hypothetical protein AVEN_176482-1 [Araneus ventricosus]|uniref:Uncharacterized protein n=1 Tax=Araneus ventricosus TaxID=182803 RepID=A0A4Y2BD39_ARAVE|nr:hypothetical protein AVEN_176482-1 [Araneus ventricosus]
MVDLEKNEIRTGGEEIPLFSASAEDSKLCSVLAKEKTITSARSECLIQGVPEASGKYRYAIMDFPTKFPRKELLLRRVSQWWISLLVLKNFPNHPSILENLEGFNEEQRTAVKEFLQEFQNLFSTSDSNVGRCNMTQHRINTGNHPPIKQYPRLLPLAKKEEAERLVKEMVDNRIIEASSGLWA